MSEKKKNTVAGKFQAYKRTSVMTANRETILLMLYQGAIRFLKQAITAHHADKFEDANISVGRVLEIVSELRASLNHKVGADIAKSLDELYLYVIEQVVQGNIDKKPEMLQSALTILEHLNETWEQAIEKLKTESNPALATKP